METLLCSKRFEKIFLVYESRFKIEKVNVFKNASNQLEFAHVV